MEDQCRSGVGRHGNPVMDPFAIAASRYNSETPEIGKMAGDFWLRTAEDLDEVADANFLISHQIQDPEPCVVAQSLEKLPQIELAILSHRDIFALTDVTVKHIFVAADVFCGANKNV